MGLWPKKHRPWVFHAFIRGMRSSSWLLFRPFLPQNIIKKKKGGGGLWEAGGKTKIN